MKFVEKLTRKSRSSGNGHSYSSSQSQDRRVSEDDIPLGTLQNSISIPPKHQIPPAKSQTHKRKAPRIDWFDFFLSAGCDMDDCTRYAAAFERDKIDESILPDITDSTMRSLGLREGDIIRVKKAIEKRKPGENLEKQSAYVQEQMKRDEELARQLQAQETGGGSSRSPAPNLFAGPAGVLKNPQRRGRKETTKTLPTNVDLNALSSASEQIQRTTSPSAMSPTTRPGSAPIQPTKVTSLPTPAPTVSSGFEDDAWAPRPSSTKPTTAVTAAPTAPVSAPTPPVPSSSAPPTTAPAAITTPTPVPTSGTPSKSLAQTNESDIFDQLARLSQLRVTTQPPVQQQQTPTAFNAGLGMSNNQLPMGQALTAQQAGLLQSSPQPPPQPQPYNGPRGPFAPVPANQSLLQPLIPTQTGFNSFIPTRAVNNPSPSPMPFQNPTSFMAPQPTGLPNAHQPMVTQPTGMPGLSPPPFGSGSIMNTSPFGSGSSFQPNAGGPFNPNSITVREYLVHSSALYSSLLTFTEPTGVFAHSPFNNPASPPPMPSGNSNTNSTTPANVFASMKSGTFAKDEDHSVPQSAGT